MRDVQTYPGADINSDHNPVVMKIKLRLKKLSKGSRVSRANLELLKRSDLRAQYAVEVKNRYDALMD